MIKKSPIKTPFFFDTPKGVDHVTKTVIENSSEKLTPKELTDINRLNRDTKLSLLKSEEQSLKKFINEDPSSYPSDPVQRGKLLNIEKLEKSLAIRSDSWKRLVKTGPLPIGKKQPDLWKDVIYPSMSPQEKGKWNLEQRKKGYNGKIGDKLYTPAQDALDNVIKGTIKKENFSPIEFAPGKMAKEVVDHINTSRSAVPDFKSDNYYPGAISTEDSISNMPVRHALRPKEPETGLSKEFTRNKLAEGKLLKEVLGE